VSDVQARQGRSQGGMPDEALQVCGVQVMSTQAERRYVNAKLSYEELRAGVRRWPDDRILLYRMRQARRKLAEAREDFRVERNGR